MAKDKTTLKALIEIAEKYRAILILMPSEAMKDLVGYRLTERQFRGKIRRIDALIGKAKTDCQSTE